MCWSTLLATAGISAVLPQKPADPAEVAKAEGRALTAAFLAGRDLEGIFQRLSPALKARIQTYEGFQAFQQNVARGLGAAPELVARIASGYVYYVSLKGVTGAGHLDLAEVAAKIPQIRKQTNLPFGVGFGIRDAAAAKAVAAFADRLAAIGERGMGRPGALVGLHAAAQGAVRPGVRPEPGGQGRSCSAARYCWR